jgi:hypothetical protein
VVPETIFREGHNRIELLAVAGTRANPRLIRLGATSRAQQYELSATSIRAPDGQPALIESGRIAGRLEDWVLDSGNVHLRGWAADFQTASAPDRNLVFASGRLIYSGETSGPRDLSPIREGEGMLRAGWTVTLPARELRSRQLRIVRGTIATELPVRYGFPWAWPDQRRP